MGWIRPDRSQMPATVVVRDFGSKEPLPAAVLERHEAVTVDRLLSLEAGNLLNGLTPLRDRALENAAYNLEAARRSSTSRTNSVATPAGRHWVVRLESTCMSMPSASMAASRPSSKSSSTSADGL